MSNLPVYLYFNKLKNLDFYFVCESKKTCLFAFHSIKPWSSNGTGAMANVLAPSVKLCNWAPCNDAGFSIVRVAKLLFNDVLLGSPTPKPAWFLCTVHLVHRKIDAWPVQPFALKYFWLLMKKSLICSKVRNSQQQHKTIKRYFVLFIWNAKTKQPYLHLHLPSRVVKIFMV